MKIIDHDAMCKMVQTDPKYISIKRFHYNILNLEDRYEETPSHIIAQALLIPESQVEDIIKNAVVKLRNLMGISI